ncbi:MAG: hypothetical protein NC390_04050 [Fusobacterium sp.]|nr:hypothetical protein [Fusobacterium sp.]
MEEKMIQILKKQVELLDEIQTVSELSDWKEKTKIFVCRIYQENSPQYKQFLNIRAYPNIYTIDTKPNVPKAVFNAKNILNGFIEDIENFGLPNNQAQKEIVSVRTPHINIENKPVFTQSQTQQQTQNTEDIIKDELPPARMREIEKVLKANEPHETKLQKVGDILQKVGIGVVSSTLAKIITSSMGVL